MITGQLQLVKGTSKEKENVDFIGGGGTSVLDLNDAPTKLLQ